MKIRMNENLATTAQQYTQGQEYEIDDAEAKRLIEGGVATDPSGKIVRKATPAPVKETLDRKPGTPIEKLPSSLPLAGHEYKDPATTTLTTDSLAPANGGIAATNAPTQAEADAANAKNSATDEAKTGKKGK